MYVCVCVCECCVCMHVCVTVWYVCSVYVCLDATLNDVNY